MNEQDVLAGIKVLKVLDGLGHTEVWCETNGVEFSFRDGGRTLEIQMLPMYIRGRDLGDETETPGAGR